MSTLMIRLIAGAIACCVFAFGAVAQVTPGQSPLSGSKGGTNNGYMQFTGPASSLKTFALPNQNDTIDTLGAVQTITAAKTFTGGLFSSTLTGGTTSSSTLTLKSSSAAANSSNTDYMLMLGTNSLTPFVPSFPTAANYKIPSFTYRDNLGRTFIIAGTPWLTDATYNCQNVQNVPVQPDSYEKGPLTVCLTSTTDGVGATVPDLYGSNAFSSTVYIKNDYNNINAIVGTAVVHKATSGGSGLVGVSICAAAAYCHSAEFAISCQYSGYSQCLGLAIGVAGGGGNYPAEAAIALQDFGAKFINGIRFEGSSNIFDGTGSIITITGGTSISLVNGTDWTPGTFSGCAFKKGGFCADNSGNVSVSQQYYINGNVFAQLSTDYHILYGPTSGAGSSILLGSSVNKQLYANADAIIFRNTAQTTTYGRFNSSGLTVGTAGATLGVLNLAGNTSGSTSISPASTASGAWTLPSVTDTFMGRTTTDTISGAKTFNDATLLMKGATSGTGTLKAPAAASTYVWTMFAATDTVACVTCSQTLLGKAFDTGGSGNSFSIAGTAVTSTTGSGAILVRATTPTITTNMTIKGTQSAMVLADNAGGGSSGYIFGRSLAGDDAQNFFMYDRAAGATRMTFSSAGLLGLPAAWTANGSVATSLGSVGPTGSHTTVQKWFTVSDGTNTYYIPAF